MLAEVNSTIKVYEGATLLGSAIANAEGVWNFVADMSNDQAAALAGAGTIDNLGVSGGAANQTQGWAFTTGALADGVHNFTATSTDAAGNVSAVSTLNVTIDTVAPNAPVITGNTIVNANQVQLTGTAESGSTVKVFDGQRPCSPRLPPTPAVPGAAPPAHCRAGLTSLRPPRPMSRATPALPHRPVMQLLGCDRVEWRDQPDRGRQQFLSL